MCRTYKRCKSTGSIGIRGAEHSMNREKVQVGNKWVKVVTRLSVEWRDLGAVLLVLLSWLLVYVSL